MSETFALPDSFTPPQSDLPLAHPNWVVYEQVAFIARLVGRSTEVPAKLRATLRGLWRTPATPELEALVDATVAAPSFEAEFAGHGGDARIAACLQRLHAAAALGEHARPVELLGELARSGEELGGALASGDLYQPKLWRPEERAERLKQLQGEAPELDKEARKQLRLTEEREARRFNEDPARQAQEAKQARIAQVATGLNAWLRGRGVGGDRFDTETFDQLQSGQLLRDFKDVHGMHPSPTALRKLFELAPDVHERLAAHQAELERLARERKLAQQRWEQTLLGQLALAR